MSACDITVTVGLQAESSGRCYNKLIMKKMFFPLFSIIEIVPAAAQNAGWGLITGTTLSQVRISTSDRCDNTSWLFGTSVGAMADMPFT